MDYFHRAAARVAASVAFCILLASVVAPARAADPAPFALKKGDHIAIVGNTLGDRMQHHGWLETLIYARHPDLELVVRNLAVAGDEVVMRHRSENFGSPEMWLKKVQADVIFAMFGFNESFGGQAKLQQFKDDLDKWIKETQKTNYSGRGNARVVLFSPIAAERHRDANYPDPAPINANLKLYTDAMREVAAANNVPFVDLFAASQKLYAGVAATGPSLTHNGLHLTEAGEQQLAPVAFREIFGESAPEAGEKLRAAINEKNAQWHARYRTVDGYNVYGGRSQLAFPSGKGNDKVRNFDVMQQEMSQRDVLTANRDKRVWAVAKGGDLKVDDSNLPPVASVPTNKPGENPDKSHKYLSGEEAIKMMTVHEGCKINLFASEEQFPELINPVQMAWDTKGRLWIAAWQTYPERTPTATTGDSLIILEDTNGDGKADKSTTFIDNLNCPTGFQFYKDGVLLMQAPDLWYIRDTNGDGKADWKERVVMGIDSADSHHTTNAMCYEPGGAVYLSDGVFHRSQIETDKGPVRNNDAAIYRFEPRTGKFETYIPYGFANPHGRVFDYWGNDLVTDATGNNTYFGPAISGKTEYPKKHPKMNEFWKRPSRPCPGTGLLTSAHFPDDWQGNFLNLNVISFQGVYRVKVSQDGSGLKGESLPDLISSKDPDFRPTAISVGPDGAIYIADWCNAIIGHMQHHIRDPNRDHMHGRVYRITYEGRPLAQQPKIAGEPIPALLDLLKRPENQIRELAKIELDTRNTAEVIAAAKKWAAGLDKNDPQYAHHLTEALWLHQWHNVVDVDLLKQVLASPEPQARAAATRVLAYWRDRVPDAIALFKAAADDADPRVRLHAVRAASYIETPQAVDVALTAVKHPLDYYLDYTLKATMKHLEPIWREALKAGTPIAVDNPAGVKFLVGSASASELLKLPKTPAVLSAIVARSDIPDADRLAALQTLSETLKQSRSAILVGGVKGSGGDAASAGAIARLLPMQPAQELAPLRNDLAALAEKGPSSDVRSSAWAALALADGNFDKAWPQASKSPAALTDLLRGIPTILDPNVRASGYDKVMPLLTAAGTPVSPQPATKGGQFVRIELPRVGTLTLAEVQVISGGQNIAPSGKAKQSSVAHAGQASRAIDGNTEGAYSGGGQTHTQEDSKNPWWELDLGGEKPIEAVIIWNRSENNGVYAKRLDGFTLTVLDASRNAIFTKADNPAPATQVRIGVTASESGPSSVRRAAIAAAVSMNHEQDKIGATLAGMIAKGDEVAGAARGLRILPRATWGPSHGAAVARDLVKWARTIPAGQRTDQDYLQSVQLAGDLAGLLPPEQAAALRKDLKELRVSVFFISAVREQMRYDQARLVVESGKPFEIIFDNPDFMPHNLVIVNPGTRAAIGAKTLTMRPDQFDKQGRAFVPTDKDVLAATKLVEPGQRETLKVLAPKQQGTYEYVCTFPGHWEVMWGTLIVTDDVDAYLQANPDTAQPKPSAAGHEHKH